ncbi:putative dsRNA-binding protein, partial [bacterium]|nr:putative dsRNA-binding protein [bacterium]
NFKDILQRYMNNTFDTKPIYKTIKVDHKNMYKSKVYKDDDFISEGIENTIKKAEQLAAKNTLIHYGVLN